jgi:hypothetical protein
LADFSDFDRYVEENSIPEKDWPAALALWIAEVTGGPVPRFEKVEREAPADGVVIEGDDLQTPGGFASVALASDAEVGVATRGYLNAPIAISDAAEAACAERHAW